MSIPATMRALQQTSLNGPQDMRLITDAPAPIPGRGEVLIRVTAAGVNFADISKAHGTFLDGPRNKRADALALPFGGSGYHFICGVVQVSGHGMWKALPRSTTFAPIAFWGHEQILLAPHQRTERST